MIKRMLAFLLGIFLLSTVLPAAGIFLCPHIAFAGGAVPDELPIAMRTFGIWDPHTSERLDFSVWYPGGRGGDDLPAVKDGWLVGASRRGRIIPGFYPVLIISHDAASSRYANNDLAASLAAGGFIVIVPSHYGDNQIDNSAVYSAELVRNRPRQLLRALETVLESPDFSMYVDESRIGLLGVGFGSTTVLQLAGAKPNFSGIKDYCSRVEEPDAFCAPWVNEKLARTAGEMDGMDNAGASVFKPPLTLYAPKLVPTEVPRDILLAYEKLNTQSHKRNQTIWEQLFGDKEHREESSQQSDQAGEGQSVEDVTGDSASANQSFAQTSENFPLELDFQGGPLFGGTDTGAEFVNIVMSDSPEYRVGEGESTAVPASPELGPDKPDPATMVFRRPAEVRRILAIALMAPAGGMLYDAESLQHVVMPVAMIEASKDALYPPDEHAQPYYAWLPAPPSVLRLPEADHFSLFAPCSEESMESLGELCGGVSREERDSVVSQRDTFLLHFFHSSMGGALPPVQPSGFIAAPEPQ